MASLNSNPLRRSLIACAVATGLALSAGGAPAQSTSDDRAPKASMEAKRAANDARKSWERTHRATKIIGAEVRNPQDQKVGRVKDLVIGDPSTGAISHVVVAVGGVMGMGDKLFAVPFRDLQQAPGKDYLVLSTNSDLSQAFDEKNWPNQAAWQQDRTQTGRTSLPPPTDTSVAQPNVAPEPFPPSNPSGSIPAAIPTPSTPDTTTPQTTQ